MNELTVKVFWTGLTESASANNHAIDRAGLSFTTLYPGGLYGVASFFVPMKATDPHEFKENRRVVIYHDTRMVWEGKIDGVVYTSTPQREGILVNCTGYWGSLLKRRRWDKVWCDTRITEVVWPMVDGHDSDIFMFDRYNRIKIEPKSAEYSQYWYGAVRYTMPTGQEIARVTCNYDFSEGAQTWRGYIYDITNTAIVSGGSVTADGSGSWDLTPSAGCAVMELRLVNDASGTTTVSNEHTVWMEFSDIHVYGELGTISMTEIVKDIRNEISELAIDERLIGTNAQVIEPCFMQNETVADFLSRLAAYGDTSLNPWAVGVDTSSQSLAVDYKPVLYFEQQPALTDYDYVLRLEDIEGGAQIEMAYDEIANWINLEYTDINGYRVRVTPEDDTDLKDDISINQFGRRDAFLRLGDTGVTEAKIYARRYLEWFKYARPRMRSPITITGTVRTKANDTVPVHWVRAGKRVLIENYLQEIGGTTLIFLITATRFDEDSGKMTITAGTPDPLDVLAARRRGI